MFGGYRSKPGVMKWRKPSPAQAVIIILTFALPILFGLLFYDKIPRYLSKILFVIWFLLACVIYIYILSHGKGKVQNTITSPEGLSGIFTIDNSMVAYSCIYPFAASVGALINRYYAAAFILLIAGFMLIALGRYYRKKLRFDDNGNFYIIQKGEERFIDFNTVKSIEGRINRMKAEALYKPIIIINFKENLGDIKRVKLKVSALRSELYGTYSPPQVILSYIKEKCISLGFGVTYLNPEETDFIAENR